ncbi:MAG: flagellar assembly protein FliH [Propionivibrio sp.]
MSGFIPKEKLTAYQRWELAAFDEAEQTAAKAAEAEKRQAETPPEPPVVLPTAADIERMHNEAQEQGYAAGYAEGIADARAVVARILSVLDSLQQAVNDLDQHIAEQLLATSIEVANQVLRQSLRVKPELLLPVVREAVTALHPNMGHPALLAHPEDAALVRAHMGEHLAHNNWRIIEDPGITRGGCRVELGASEVDATLETRWKRVIEAIGVSQEWLNDKP